jgi:Flp pilus assembly protein TadG
MRLRTAANQRRGASAAETAVTLLTFLTLVLGMLDLALGVLHYHCVSQAARQGARLAIVHGSMAPSGWNGGPWGPAAYGPVAGNNSTPLATALAPYLAGLDASQARVSAQWPDGSNEPESRVRVTVTYPYRPMITFIFGRPTYTLSATSTMIITH